MVTGVILASPQRSAADRQATPFTHVVGQTLIWGINSFDQWGVELGKAFAQQVAGELASGEPEPDRHDESMSALIVAVLDHRGSAFVGELDLMEGRST